MSVAFDAEAAILRYKDAETEELVKIAFVQPDNYVEQAVALARDELRQRGIGEESHPAVVLAVSNVNSDIATKEVISNLPANPIWLVVCFLFADIVAIVTACLYSVAGRKRAATQTWKAFGYGWLARFVVIGFLIIRWGK